METVRGFRDYVGEDALKRAEVKKILVDTLEKYGFEPAETPVIEYEEFVKGDSSNQKDEAISDIFKLKDKGKRDLALRYEFTFQLKRIATNKKLPYKRYQIGTLFRDEPVGPNRFRQFVQCDADIIGSTIKDEAEIFSLAKEIFEKSGVEFTIYVNSRKLLNELLGNLGINDNRDDVLREIDKLDKIPEKEVRENLKNFGAEKILLELKKPEKDFEKYSSYNEIRELKKYLKSNYGFEVEFSPSLVRGLSYYTGNVFEIKGKGMKETICAGGCYEINGNQSFGISFGLDRISNIAKIPSKRNKILVVSLDEDKQSIKIADKLRSLDNKVSIFYGKPSKALEYANSYDYNQIIFVGAQEVKKKKVKIKDMASGKEKLVTLGKISKKNLIFQRK